MTNNRNEKSHQMNSCVCRFLENEEKNNEKILKTGQSYLVKYKKTENLSHLAYGLLEVQVSKKIL